MPKFPELTYSIGAPGSMARSSQAVTHILHDIPDMIHACHEQMTSNYEAGVGNNNGYQMGCIDQLTDLQIFLQNAINE